MLTMASELARRLAINAEAVCGHYLSNGYRQGRYWLVGDVGNTTGRSLYVRLHGPETGRGAAGKWTDAATGEHGDLLDLIAANRRIDVPRDVLDEARRFLSLPMIGASPRQAPAPAGSSEAARRLFAASKPLLGTIAETYLRERGITALQDCKALRFHPRCFYRPDGEAPAGANSDGPALIAAITSVDGALTGVHRTWLDPSGLTKTQVGTPRRAMGHLLGNAVRFGEALDVMAAGEGIETMLSPRSVMPTLPMAAALSANHLAALVLPRTLHRLYIARDNDPAGQRAMDVLTERAQAGGIEALVLAPTLGDFNDDLRQLGPDALAAALRLQLVPEDVGRFWRSPEPSGRTVSVVAARKMEMAGPACACPAGEPRPRPSERAIGPEADRASKG